MRLATAIHQGCKQYITVITLSKNALNPGGEIMPDGFFKNLAKKNLRYIGLLQQQHKKKKKNTDLHKKRTKEKITKLREISRFEKKWRLNNKDSAFLDVKWQKMNRVTNDCLTND